MLNDTRHLHLPICGLDFEFYHRLYVAKKRLGRSYIPKPKIEKLSELFSGRVKVYGVLRKRPFLFLERTPRTIDDLNRRHSPLTPHFSNNRSHIIRYVLCTNRNYVDVAFVEQAPFKLRRLWKNNIRSSPGRRVR